MPRSRTQPSTSSPATPQTPELLGRKRPSTRRFARKKYVEVTCTETGFQHGSRKIYQSEDPDETRLKEWRNNLTALSQRYNLYLVAGREKIWAYQPEYPCQRIPDHPQLMVASPRFDENSQGYIDVNDPHAINYLVIANFGKDEIVVCACDDGDVYAYLTQQIVDALLERQQSQNADRSVLVGHLKPFFHQNITLSAWGLAVHEEARLIAASCNSHDIYVFAFALSSATDSSPEDSAHTFRPLTDLEEASRPPLDVESNAERSSDDSEDDPLHDPSAGFDARWPLPDTLAGWKRCPDPQKLAQREDNYLIRLAGHSTNVPALAFCNTGDDRQGRFLMSTDIDGTTIVWDVINMAPERVRQAGHDVSSSGWAVHWLDRRSFRRSTSQHAFLEHTKYGVFNFDTEFATVDLSDTRSDLSKSSYWDPTNPEGVQSTMEDTDDFEDLLDAGLDLIERRMNMEGPFEMDSDDSSSDGGVPFSRQSASRRLTSRSTLQGPKSLHSGLKDYTGLPGWHCMCGWPVPSQVASFAQESGTELPTTPVMRFTANALTLYQSASLEHASRSQPFTVFEEPLAQDGPADMVFRMRHMDRMNLTLQIPDLGLVLAGSQKGRVGIFSMHQVWPNPFVESSAAPAFTIRLDAVLPTPAQEAESKRPLSCLVGLAAAPVQGLQSAVAGALKSRWRVMMLYRDHTILAYEVAREREAVSPVHGGGTGIAVSRDDVPFV